MTMENHVTVCAQVLRLKLQTKLSDLHDTWINASSEMQSMHLHHNAQTGSPWTITEIPPKPEKPLFLYKFKCLR